MPKYTIKFDFPEGPIYAGQTSEGAGWAFELATAWLFDTRTEAENWLANGYGSARKHGTVIEVPA